MLWAWLPRKSGGAIQGRIQDFPNWGVETTIRKAGGGGGGGGSVRFRPETKRGRGGWGWCCTLQNVGGGCLAKMREVPSMKGGVVTPKPPPPPPPPPPLLGATGRSVIGDINYALMTPPNSCAALFVPEADTGFSDRE